jgi:striatin 1/3/4
VLALRPEVKVMVFDNHSKWVLNSLTDIALPSEQRLSITGLPSNNGVPPAGPSSRKDNMSASWPGVPANGNTPALHLNKPLPGRDPKSRARSRDYLKQCVVT